MKAKFFEFDLNGEQMSFVDNMPVLTGDQYPSIIVDKAHLGIAAGQSLSHAKISCILYIKKFIKDGFALM